MDYISLGSKIRARRQELKLTQEKLAEKANITTSFLGHIERAERKLSVETLIAIANALNTSVDYLLCDSLLASGNDTMLGSIKESFANQSPVVKTAAVELVKNLLANMVRSV
ncbi:MAG: helix-turn-helix domain-containing protein [Defluviitaleaceae bacterium]|nr:helix-turn-helix domain-containing protein [Defluviitaleaceae bacterium]